MTTRAAAPADGTATAARPLHITDEEFHQLSALVHRETGIALGEHKRELVCARLGKRLRRRGYASFSRYCEHLAQEDRDGQELAGMVNAITTTKTEFFRDERHFAALRTALQAPGAGAAPRGWR